MPGMVAYCALLRGIAPSNPNMRNEKLRGVFEGLGFGDVASVLASGNIVFSAPDTTVPALESRIQEGLATELGIKGGTILRTRDELADLLAAEPFGDLEHSRETYLTATFLKVPLDPVPDPMPGPDLPSVRLVGYDREARAILTVTDNTDPQTPDFMQWLEKVFRDDAVEITTRTWLTVQRILKKMPAS